MKNSGYSSSWVGLAVVAVDAVAVGERVAAVGAGHPRPVLGHVTEALVVEAARLDHQLGRHRQVAENPTALGRVGAAALDHPPEAPDRHPAPGSSARKKSQYCEHVAEHAVGDVVGGQPEALDRQAGLAVGPARRARGPRPRRPSTGRPDR